jgi:hypothetical protein
MVRSDPTLSGSGYRFRSDYGGNNMTRDWILTMLMFSPSLLTAVIIVLALIRRLAQIELARRRTSVRVHDGADQMEEAKRILS